MLNIGVTPVEPNTDLLFVAYGYPFHLCWFIFSPTFHFLLRTRLYSFFSPIGISFLHCQFTPSYQVVLEFQLVTFGSTLVQRQAERLFLLRVGPKVSIKCDVLQILRYRLAGTEVMSTGQGSHSYAPPLTVIEKNLKCPLGSVYILKSSFRDLKDT